MACKEEVFLGLAPKAAIVAGHFPAPDAPPFPGLMLPPCLIWTWSPFIPTNTAPFSSSLGSLMSFPALVALSFLLH